MNQYEVEKYVERILNGGQTGFVGLDVVLKLQGRLKKGMYKIFKGFGDAEKVILYANDRPRVVLVKICCSSTLEHKMVLGSLFGLQIEKEMFGDVVFYDGNFYVYFLSDIYEMVKMELLMIGRFPVVLEEVEFDFLKDYERDYEKFKIIVSSVRLDNVIAKVMGCNRERVLEVIRNNEVFLNNEVVKKNHSLLRVGDIFSIRHVGKFKFVGGDEKTKKGNFIVEVWRYC